MLKSTSAQAAPIHPHFVPVTGNYMAPTLHDGDLVGMVPVDHFRGDGLYLVSFMGKASIYRVSSNLHDGVDLRCDGEEWFGQSASLDDFAELVVAQVAATLSHDFAGIATEIAGSLSINNEFYEASRQQDYQMVRRAA